MPRFVLLYHHCPANSPRPSHCDLMLEAMNALRTWAVAELPYAWAATAGLLEEVRVARLGASNDGRGLRFAVANTVAAEELADHRLAYLEYEGPVSGDRGAVIRLDSGTFVSLQESAESWIVELTGHLIRARVTLRHNDANSSHWELSFQESVTIDRQ
jgi:hypothetical protein